MHRQAFDSLKADSDLRPYVADFGPLELEPVEDTFERLVVSLIRQQVSIEAAAAIQERLFERFEITPERLLAADEDRLRDCGLSAAKAEYVKATADAYREHGYDRAYFEGMADAAVVDELTDIRGVGPWTAKMFLLFALGRPDVFPVEDLGVRKGMAIVCGTGDAADVEMTRGEMRERAAAWEPYRSYASLYLWRAYEG